MEEFMEDIGKNKEMRKNINLYTFDGEKKDTIPIKYNYGDITLFSVTKKYLLVIKEGSKQLLIASDEGRTTFLTELDEKEKLQKSIEQMTSKLSGAKMYNSGITKKINTPVMRGILTKLK